MRSSATKVSPPELKPKPAAQATSRAGPEAAAGSHSDFEGPNVGVGGAVHKEEPTSPVAPLAPFPPVPPAASRTRAPEFYGFVAWTGTYLLFAAYLLWAVLPDAAIQALGVDWYPNRCVAIVVSPASGAPR